MTQERCFRAAEPLDESSSAKLLMFPCAASSALQTQRHGAKAQQVCGSGHGCEKAPDVPDWRQLRAGTECGRESSLRSVGEAPSPRATNAPGS